MKERKDFNKLNESEKNQALIKFNKIFNSGLIVLIIGILLYLTLIIVISSGVDFLWIPIAILASVFVFIAWIMSLVGLNKVRKIRLDKSDKSKSMRQFRLKLNLMRFVAFIGIATCIITLFGGVLLLILWAFRIL